MLIKKKRTGTSNSYLITIRKEDANYIKAIKDIDNIKIKFEHYIKKSTPTQCYRCQTFGHGSSNCTKKPKCLKCARCHLTSECPIKHKNGSNRQLLRCANCGGPHPANFSKCPTLMGIMERQQVSQKPAQNNTRTPKTQPPTLTNVNFPPLPQKNNTNYTTPTHNTPPNLTTLMTELTELNTMCNIESLIQLIKEFKEGLKTCNNTLDRLTLLLTLADKYDKQNV